MRVVITGAAGLVARNLAERYREHDVVALAHRDLDIGDAAAVDAAIDRLRPALVFNGAVIGVDDCEADPARAERVNVTGPAALARAAERHGATFVHFSTNYVFDGRRTDGLPYTIDDHARPINVYGETKLRGERAAAAACERTFIVRTSWVFGRGKASFLSTVGAKLSAGERVQAIVDSFASSTYVDDLGGRVDDVLRHGRPGTYHLVNGGVCSYEEFAREAARLLNVSDEEAARLIERRTEESMARPAPRPRWTPMRCLLSERLGLPPLRPWQDALAAFLRA